MLFNSLDYFLFLPLVFILYWFVTYKKLAVQNGMLLVMSYVFYGWWDWRFLGLMAATALVEGKASFVRSPAKRRSASASAR